MWLVVLGIGVVATPSAAQGFEIETGFSEACHESMTGEQAMSTVIASDMVPVIDAEVELPASRTWEKLADVLLEDLDVRYDNKHQKFVLVSLVLGSRYPDSGGTSVINLSSSRQMHVNPSAQQQHCLRRGSDDGPKGSPLALQATREHIRQTLDRAISYADLPARDQLITRETFVEFYGEVDVTVWAPAFFAGAALHTFQDCFSHTIRTDDLTQVLHVLNYVDAITEDYEPARDGLAHSRAMDQCAGEAAELADQASAATKDFLAAFSEMYRGQDPHAIDAVLQDWTSYRSGCTVDNDICDSTWLAIAEQGQASPLVDTPSCTAARRARGTGLGGSRWIFLGWLLLMVGCRAGKTYASTSRTNSRNK